MQWFSTEETFLLKERGRCVLILDASQAILIRRHAHSPTSQPPSTLIIFKVTFPQIRRPFLIKGIKLSIGKWEIMKNQWKLRHGKQNTSLPCYCSFYAKHIRKLSLFQRKQGTPEAHVSPKAQPSAVQAAHPVLAERNGGKREHMVPRIASPALTTSF